MPGQEEAPADMSSVPQAGPSTSGSARKAPTLIKQKVFKKSICLFGIKKYGNFQGVCFNIRYIFFL